MNQIKFKDWLLVENHEYSCVMAMIPPPLSSKIITWTSKHVPNEHLTAKGIENEPHITVLYGLHTNDFRKIKNLLSDIRLEAKLGVVSKFESPEFDVLKLEVESDSFRLLHRKLKTLKFTSDFPTYRPHCTLAYVKKGSCDHLLNNQDFNNIKIGFNSVLFSPAMGQKVPITLM
ncbi:MAG: hypothetical protein DWQ19_11725 [Crenarchaeota archaeon]|nr:MAG: hypothetical protein DWQ19_11725 [Thermoproteota archaeon]